MADVKPRMRFSIVMDCWEVRGPAFLGEPLWLGIRRAACPYHAYEDWLAMYNAHSTIYRVKGLKVPAQ